MIVYRQLSNRKVNEPFFLFFTENLCEHSSFGLLDEKQRNIIYNNAHAYTTDLFYFPLFLLTYNIVRSFFSIPYTVRFHSRSIIVSCLKPRPVALDAGVAF